jgi:hypothetical protein
MIKCRKAPVMLLIERVDQSGWREEFLCRDEGKRQLIKDLAWNGQLLMVLK